MRITLYATARASPCSSSTQKIIAMAASSSSTTIPAEPTTTRLVLERNSEAAEASTYGTGMKTRNMIPMSWTSPPQALTA